MDVKDERYLVRFGFDMSFRGISYIATDHRAPFYQHGLPLIPAWISNYIHYKEWGEITYPFLNFNGVTVEV